MRSVVIMGAGELGSALARQLAATDVVAHITLVDDAGTVAAGKALDILQAAPVDGYKTRVDGTADDRALIGADAVVVADRAADSREWQGDTGVQLVRRIAELNSSALILCAGGTHLDVIERAVRETGMPRHRLIGSAPEALRAAVVAMTCLEARCAPGDVSLTVVGRPPGQTIVPWDDAAIAGRRAVDILSPPAITRLDARLPRLWPPGPLTLASAATRLLRAAASGGHHALCVFVAVTREEGDRGRVGMLPVRVNARGLDAVLPPTLSVRDRVRLDTALSSR